MQMLLISINNIQNYSCNVVEDKWVDENPDLPDFTVISDKKFAGSYLNRMIIVLS